MALPDVKYLKSVLDYSPDTGKLVWKTNCAGYVSVGSNAGTLCAAGGRERMVTINGRRYPAILLVWHMYYCGLWPVELHEAIDRIDGDRGNLAISNLRIVTKGQYGSLWRNGERNPGTRFDCIILPYENFAPHPINSIACDPYAPDSPSRRFFDPDFEVWRS